MSDILKINNLSIAFGGLKAVDNLSMTIRENEIYGLIGPNGAGKTTVFNCITQFYSADSGEILFNNKNNQWIDLNTLSTHEVIKEGLVRTFQNVELVAELTVLENVLLGSHIHFETSMFSQFFQTKKVIQEEKLKNEEAMQVLDKVGISEYAESITAGLSYGIRKKIELARTLMSNPKLIILDEPAAGLNDQETIEFISTIKSIRDEYNCTILLVEHDMGMIMNVCDRITAISFGKHLATGTPEEIQNDPLVVTAYLGEDEDE